MAEARCFLKDWGLYNLPLSCPVAVSRNYLNHRGQKALSKVYKYDAPLETRPGEIPKRLSGEERHGVVWKLDRVGN